MRKSLFFFFSITFSTLILKASPHPTTASSNINQIQSGQIFSQMGFKLNFVPPTWTWGDRDIQKNQFELKHQTSRLSFNFEETKSPVDLENFIKKYLRDYHQFGFDIVGQDTQKINKKTVSVVLDLRQKNNKTYSRQIFFQNGKKIVTATCIDRSDTSEQSLIECQKILNSFTWIN